MTARRTKRSRRSTPRIVASLIALALALAVVLAFLRYRQVLERPDPLMDRIARNAPDRIAIREIVVLHPGAEGEGMVWSRVNVPLSTVDPAILGRTVATAWAERVESACGRQPVDSPVAHFFFDDRRIAYIDFDPGFFSVCRTGTTGELELLEAIEHTVRTNIPATTAVVLMSGGVPLETAWGHIALDAGRVIP